VVGWVATQNIEEIMMQIKDVTFVLNMSKGFELGNLLNSAIIRSQSNPMISECY
jgi:hypothetical protein